MSTALDNEEDLQSYFNSLNKDMDEATESLELAEAVKTLTGEDDDGAQGQHEILTGSGSDNETTLFLDQDGNYFLRSPPTAANTTTTTTAMTTRRATTRAAQSTRNTPSTSSKTRKLAAKSNAAKNNDEKTDYVVVVADSTIKAETATEHADADDAGDTKDRIYEFDEEDEDETKEENDDDDAEFQVLSKTIKLKPNINSNEVVHKCSHCEYTTTKHYLLLRHCKVHSDDRPYKCSVCERGFKTNSSLHNHLNSHLGNKPHACKHCAMAFTTAGELVRHTRYRHTGEKPHKCSECDYSSVELSKLRRHIRCHTGERPYQCPHCTYASPDTFKLKRHLRTHTGEKPYECEICHSRFTQSNSLKAHRLIHSVGNKPIYPCALCPTTCGRKTDLRLHVQKLHQSEHPIRCKRCGKDLPDRYSYKMHIKSHEGEKCYRCTICPYASVSMRHLESHMLVHSDEKPFVCNLCNIAFRQQQLLKRHNNLYHNKNYVPPAPRAKVHTCPHCTRTFTHKGNMLRHMEVHDPESNVKKEKLDLKLGRSTRLRTAKDDDTSGENTVDEQDILEEDDNDDDDNGDDDDAEAEFIYDKEYEDKVENADDGGEIDMFATDTFEIIETIDDEFESKAIVKIEDSKEMEANSSKSLTKRPVKEESKTKKIVAVEVGDDDEQYMVVEVIQCEDDDDDDDDDDGEFLNITTTSIKQNSTNDIDNCFGFQDDNKSLHREFSADAKSSIQLLDIIDDM